MSNVAEVGNRQAVARPAPQPATGQGNAARPNANAVPQDSFTPGHGNSNPNALWDTARSQFGGWDRNRDGHLTNREVETALWSQNLSVNQKAAPSAYLDSGLQHVPYGDRIRIGLTPDTSDLLTLDGVKQAVHTGGVVVAQDIRNVAVSAGNGIADGFNWVGRQLGF